MSAHGQLEDWSTQVRRHVLTEALGAEAAERQMVRSQLLVPELPDDLRDEGLLARRSADGAGTHPRSAEQRARDAGLSVEQWRKLSR